MKSIVNYFLLILDPDLMKKKQDEMEATRRRMQEEMDQKAVLHAAKMKEV